ncbi:MAG: aldehyde dehydrogenase family protein [Burkholderiales bacterium]|jgi:hypothetical protein
MQTAKTDIHGQWGKGHEAHRRGDSIDPATRYGWAASVWTQDFRAARQLARRIKFGNVWGNSHNRPFAEIESRGYRQSGFGRLYGVEGLNDFMETKHATAAEHLTDLAGAVRRSLVPLARLRQVCAGQAAAAHASRV